MKFSKANKQQTQIRKIRNLVDRLVLIKERNTGFVDYTRIGSRTMRLVPRMYSGSARETLDLLHSLRGLIGKKQTLAIVKAVLLGKQTNVLLLSPSVQFAIKEHLIPMVQYAREHFAKKQAAPAGSLTIDFETYPDAACLASSVAKLPKTKLGNDGTVGDHISAGDVVRVGDSVHEAMKGGIKRGESIYHTALRDEPASVITELGFRPPKSIQE